ncbi:hypothetical protein B2H94_05180 [Clostridium sporogenes]|uniref:DUF1657 domain-containing protein n=3 Tax=Clostridium TaxID=1485 RepID=A0AAE4Z4U1_CLOSG|nr:MULTISPECIES: DUF1657 domain-containing protein [Clostridium]MBE6076468.1 DUF1657 domain-containing protein [Clostridium lundense]EDU37430.1 hypothetical protein CLOSPO_03599 [Clostridium sporogenes ATCC 15579]EKS4342165.1 DUF1657 domain-containing protein [Clostridium botulinum]EKS4393632.1 DUF1657 domain-containing protein [Clostridium botulinum]KIS23364.1 hypothetical protein N495_07100 [Clostridium botulinum B2 450]
MTVINKLNQTMEMLKSTESNCKTFSMDTDDPNAKQMFNQMAENMKMCENMLQSRINFVMSEEPQYQPEQQQQQIQQEIQMQQQQQDQQQQ